MIRSTPPQLATPNPIPQNPIPFSVNPDVSVEHALLTASDYLTCAAATAYEVADNSPLEFRPLARSVVHQLDAARALLEASIAGLDRSMSVGKA
jgi:hypothetical protein